MKSRGLFLVLALAIPVWGAGVLLAPSALCGPEDKKGGQGGGEAGKKKEKEERAVQRALRMQEIEIHGDVEKPKTMFVIPRASLQLQPEGSRKGLHERNPRSDNEGVG